MLDVSNYVDRIYDNIPDGEGIIREIRDTFQSGDLRHNIQRAVEEAAIEIEESVRDQHERRNLLMARSALHAFLWAVEGDARMDVKSWVFNDATMSHLIAIASAVYNERRGHQINTGAGLTPTVHTIV